jgi:hypothetical protein
MRGVLMHARQAEFYYTGTMLRIAHWLKCIWTDRPETVDSLQHNIRTGVMKNPVLTFEDWR